MAKLNADKQWDLGYELSKKDPVKAIEQYKLALKISGHPFLYTNIAAAYHRLGDYENSAKWYKKSEDLLLNLEDKYSANPYANYAYFLYNEKSYEKALKFSKIAMEIDSETMIFVENHVRILLALNLKDEALPFLAKLRLVVPDWESVQDLLKENEKEINDYYQKQWELKDKLLVMEDILKLHDIDKEAIIKYLKSKKGVIPDIRYDKWDSIFKDMLGSKIEITDNYFIKLFKILIKREEYLKLFNFFNYMIEQSVTGYLLILKLMKLAGVKKKTVVFQLLRSVNSDNEEILIDALVKDLIPSYKRDLKSWESELNSPMARVILIRVMQKVDSEYFKDSIKAYLTKNINSKKFNLILSKLTDEKLKEELYLAKLKNWLENISEFKGNKEFFKLLKTFITTNNKNIINKIIVMYGDLIKYDSYFNFWDNFVYNFPRENNERLYDKSFKLSLIFSPSVTLQKHIGFGESFDSTLKLLEKYNIPNVFYIKYLIKEIYKSDDKGHLIIEFINKKFDDVLIAFEMISIKEKAAILPLIWENQSDKAKKLLIDLTSSSSKTLQNTVKDILKKDNTLINEVTELLKARRVSTRTIAVEVLLSKKDEELNKIIKEHLKTEKSDAVRKLINKVLE